MINRPLHQFIIIESQHYEDTLHTDIIENNIDNVAVKLKQLTQEEIDSINKDESCKYVIDAATLGRIEIIKLLDEYGINIHKTNRNFGAPYNALHEVKIFGDNAIDTIQYLIDRGVDVNLKDAWNNTPVWKMVAVKRAKSILLMLKAGANVEGKGHSGQPLTIEIKELLDNKVEFINIHTEEHPIYRMLNDDGYPAKTVKERKKHEFKSHLKTNSCVAFSLFKNMPVINQVLRDRQLATDLSLNDIQSAAAVSAVRDKDGDVMNSRLLNEVDQDVNVHLSFRK